MYEIERQLEFPTGMTKVLFRYANLLRVLVYLQNVGSQLCFRFFVVVNIRLEPPVPPNPTSCSDLALIVLEVICYFRS